MFKATVILIIANHWLYEVNSLPTYKDRIECITGIHDHLQAAPQSLLDAGFGVYDMECVFIPFPRERP